MERTDPKKVAASVLVERYGGADSLLLAGSVVRAEETATSDLDLIVLYPHVEQSYRESFTYAGWPIEAFVHDEYTIEYNFVEQDRASGIGSIMWMVHDGVAIPEPTTLNRRIKLRAQQLLDSGPPTWSVEQIDRSRYTITGLLDDLAAPRNDDEYRATLSTLYPLVANHFLRVNRQWAASAKTIPRRLLKADDDLARRYGQAFAAAFTEGDSKLLFAVVDQVLDGSGGRLFEGYSALTDPDSRRSPPCDI